MSEARGPKKEFVKAKISAIEFPEVCPVCLDSAEDLVFITVVDRLKQDDYIGTSWSRQEDKLSSALSSARGYTTFAVPTCMAHGSKSVRTFRTKLVAILGFFVMFYPALYFILELNAASYYSGPMMSSWIGLIGSIAILIGALLYGLIPRALERKLRFIDIARAKDAVVMRISNQDYRTQFLEVNGLNAELVDSDEL